MNRTDNPRHRQDAEHDAQLQLSALADGELEPTASRFLLRRLDNDAQLRESWNRWHLAGACLRRSRLLLLPDGFAERVSLALQAEQAPRRRTGAVLRWAAGGAVAASVALLALLAARPPSAPVVETGPAPLAAAGDVAEAPLSERDLRPDYARVPAQPVAATRTQRVSEDRFGRGVITDPRIEAYLVRHNQALQAQGRGGLMPYVYVVAQPAQGTVRPVTADGRR